MANKLTQDETLIFHVPSSKTFVRVDLELQDDGVSVQVAGGPYGGGFPVSQNVFVRGYQEPKSLVGIVLNQGPVSPREAEKLKVTNRVFTYEALDSLGLRIGDYVVCPVGILNGPQTHTINGTVVTLDPNKVAFKMRTITERA